MSKTHFLQNKQVHIAIAIGIGALLLFIVNVAVLTTSVIDVFVRKPVSVTKQPIETETVDQALDVLSGNR